jgi:transcription termination factor NusB
VLQIGQQKSQIMEMMVAGVNLQKEKFSALIRQKLERVLECLELVEAQLMQMEQLFLDLPQSLVFLRMTVLT